MRLILLFLAMVTPLRAGSIKVAAAISLRETMTEIAADYEKTTHERVEVVFGSSGQLQAQIKSGAPIDVFISAADAQVDDLIRAKLADESSRRTIAKNEMVLIVPANSSDKIDSFVSLKDSAVKKVAIGEPRTVPAGQYAMQVLKNAKIDQALGDKLVYGTNVRQVLEYVQRAEVSAGIVYATDAKEAGDNVKVVATAAPQSHDAIRYPAILIKSSGSAELARKFLDYLCGEPARAALRAHGFVLPDADRHNTPATRS